MDLGLAGRNVVVTGGSRGIGRQIALAFARKGANVALCARHAGPLAETEADLRRHGVNVCAARCDIGVKPELEAFLEQARHGLGSVDVLVNNPSALAMTDDPHGWEASLNIDLMASVHATWKVVPWMEAAGGGCMLFLSSGSGLEAGSPPAYAAAKAAIISYSKTLSVDLAPKRIRVNTLAPGSIEFGGGYWDRERTSDPALYERVRASIPWGRMGTPQEVADVAVFLCSPRASWVTGVCLAVDGAQHKGNL
ncbi:MULTISPECIES: SDR family NAD(P)-dependent oxidoreductase [unclassified Cyanobium]|uniref:SDR family NAD(P)-dependent oxidoreductase n=1 Tax=unclassified Cyanobium TaxID=2627006 RepID=UPI0020CDAF13|nr:MULTISPECIES: SDR family oxidoreductase [unclassified Cyanobium]MCP9860886.1 SDR family oxidoreductase [Cyanobium sp. Cruz-8H5]MCP9868111.1 SDR family oxidoreductase [Cyanobium sp. Cruz-8D1]